MRPITVTGCYFTMQIVNIPHNITITVHRIRQRHYTCITITLTTIALSTISLTCRFKFLNTNCKLYRTRWAHNQRRFRRGRCFLFGRIVLRSRPFTGSNLLGNSCPTCTWFTSCHDNVAAGLSLHQNTILIFNKDARGNLFALLAWLSLSGMNDAIGRFNFSHRRQIISINLYTRWSYLITWHIVRIYISVEELVLEWNV
mmetsp:Transcript_17062/g.25644  ORF Transcript_17062/g.25644 Transcript_17062/m.25644 type:complete len:200 (-) Transcript_17062:1004-1603(-)